MAGVAAGDLASIAELEATIGGQVEVDTGWRSQSYGNGWKAAWIVRHPPKDCEHGVVLIAGDGPLDSFETPPEPVVVTGADWGLAGRGAVSQIVRFGFGTDAYSLHVESMQDTARPRLVELVRVLAPRLPRAEPPGGLAQFLTHADAVELFGAPAGFPNVYADHVVTWHHFATVAPTMMETLLLQRPQNTEFDESPTIETPFVTSRSQRTHAPEGTPGTVDASSEVWWVHGDTLYRLSRNRHAYGASATPEYLPVEPLIELARRIDSRLDEAAR